jgi:digeranylgeranylglycerophospholipid reductase
MRVAIVGGGICGLYLGWKLAEKKEEVFIFEKEKGVGEKACSTLLSERIFKFLPFAKEYIQNKIKYSILHFERKDVFLKFKEDFFIFDRKSLQNHLLELAQKKGAKIFLEKKIDFDFLNSAKNDFDRIIGADGAQSIVRKFLNLKEPNFFLGVQGFLEKNDFSNVVEVWPTKNGFLWKIPRGKDVEYGILELKNLAGKIFREFQEKNNLKFKKIRSALIPQDLILSFNPRIAICGDASGLTKPWSGGGIIWNLIQADIILKNYPDFVLASKEIKRFFNLKIYFSKILKKIVLNFPPKLHFLFPSLFKVDGDFLFF